MLTQVAHNGGGILPKLAHNDSQPSTTDVSALFDLVTFAVSSGNIGSIVLTDDGAAFEFGLSATPIIVAATPLPAGLPLFATGIGGLGLLGWRSKRKSRAGVNGFSHSAVC